MSGRADSKPNAAARLSLGLVIPLRWSVMGSPEFSIRCRIWSGLSLGKASLKTATAPATWGAAIEVPCSSNPPASIKDPGANISRNWALLEKDVTRSGTTFSFPLKPA